MWEKDSAIEKVWRSPVVAPSAMPIDANDAFFDHPFQVGGPAPASEPHASPSRLSLFGRSGPVSTISRQFAHLLLWSVKAARRAGVRGPQARGRFFKPLCPFIVAACFEPGARASLSAYLAIHVPPTLAASARVGMPPDLRNHLEPTGGDTPASRAASSLERPVAIAAQNRTSSSRRAESGRPGECNLLRPDRSDRRLSTVIATSYARVLRRPIEVALCSSSVW